MATSRGSWESYGFVSAPQASYDHHVGSQPAVRKSLVFEDPEGSEVLPANMLDAPFDVLWARAISDVMTLLQDHQFKEAACILARAHELNKHSRKIEQDAEQADTPFHEFLRLQVHHEQRTLLTQFYALRKATQVPAADISSHPVFNSGSSSPPPAPSHSSAAGHPHNLIETDVNSVSANRIHWQDHHFNMDDNTMVSVPPHDGPSEKMIEYVVENPYAAPRLPSLATAAPLKVPTKAATDNFTVGGSQLGFLKGDDGLDILEKMQQHIMQLHHHQEAQQHQNLHGSRSRASGEGHVGMTSLGPVYEQRPWSEPWDAPQITSLKMKSSSVQFETMSGAHSDAGCWERATPEHASAVAMIGAAVQERQEAVAKQQGPKAQSLTLSTSLQLLGKEDPVTIFIVRRINKLGFKAGRRLTIHFSRFGEVRRVLIARSNRKEGVAEDHTQWRRRPSSLGFVQMCSSAAVAQVLAMGNEQEVGGFPILVERFEKLNTESEPCGPDCHEELSYL